MAWLGVSTYSEAASVTEKSKASSSESSESSSSEEEEEETESSESEETESEESEAEKNVQRKKTSRSPEVQHLLSLYSEIYLARPPLLTDHTFLAGPTFQCN